MPISEIYPAGIDCSDWVYGCIVKVRGLPHPRHEGETFFLGRNANQPCVIKRRDMKQFLWLNRLRDKVASSCCCSSGCGRAARPWRRPIPWGHRAPLRRSPEQALQEKLFLHLDRPVYLMRRDDVV